MVIEDITKHFEINYIPFTLGFYKYYLHDFKIKLLPSSILLNSIYRKFIEDANN